MKRSPLRRRTPMRRQSTSHQQQRAEYTEFRADYLAAHPECEAFPRCDDWRDPVCTIRADQLHHIKPRGRGGAVTAADNVLAVCGACHRWIHANPIRARELRLLI